MIATCDTEPLVLKSCSKNNISIIYYIHPMLVQIIYPSHVGAKAGSLRKRHHGGRNQLGKEGKQNTPTYVLSQRSQIK